MIRPIGRNPFLQLLRSRINLRHEAARKRDLGRAYRGFGAQSCRQDLSFDRLQLISGALFILRCQVHHHRLLGNNITVFWIRVCFKKNDMRGIRRRFGGPCGTIFWLQYAVARDMPWQHHQAGGNANFKPPPPKTI
jgi:hypothetical protein